MSKYKHQTTREYPYGKDFNLVWCVKTKHPERKGDLCRIFKTSYYLNENIIEFMDGKRIIANRNHTFSCNCPSAKIRGIWHEPVKEEEI